MSDIINNIDLDKISKTIEEGKNNLSTLRRPIKLEAEWNLYDPESAVRSPVYTLTLIRVYSPILIFTISSTSKLR